MIFFGLLLKTDLDRYHTRSEDEDLFDDRGIWIGTTKVGKDLLPKLFKFFLRQLGFLSIGIFIDQFGEVFFCLPHAFELQKR